MTGILRYHDTPKDITVVVLYNYLLGDVFYIITLRLGISSTVFHTPWFQSILIDRQTTLVRTCYNLHELA